MDFKECKFCSQPFKPRKATSSFCSGHCRVTYLRRKKIIPDKPRQGIYKKCPVCQKEFYVEQYRKDTATFCSRSCLAKVHLKKYAIFRFQPLNNPPHKYKYITINGKSVREHRYLMECHLNRKLKPEEHVHHVNGNSSDNRIENLIILSNSNHQKTEHALRQNQLTSNMVCPYPKIYSFPF